MLLLTFFVCLFLVLCVLYFVYSVFFIVLCIVSCFLYCCLSPICFYKFADH